MQSYDSDRKWWLSMQRLPHVRGQLLFCGDVMCHAQECCGCLFIPLEFIQLLDLTHQEFAKLPNFSHISNFYAFFITVSSIMTLSSTNAYKGLDRAFCVRMKSTLTKRGCHFKSSGYRVYTRLN